MGIKSIWLIALLMTTLLVVASLDAAPDPPAIDPHAVNVKAVVMGDVAGGLRSAHLERDSFREQVRVPARGVQLTDTVEPQQPSEGPAIVSHGSDPSPPLV